MTSIQDDRDLFKASPDVKVPWFANDLSANRT